MSKIKKWSIVLTVMMLAAVVSFSFACTSASAAPAETKAAEEAAPVTEAEAEVQTTEAPAEEVVQAAGDCPSATSVSVASTNGAYADREPINWDSIGAQAAYVTNTMNNTAVAVYIANFDTSENLKDAALGDGQAMIYFSIRVRGEGDPVPIEMGVYAMRDYDNNDLYVEPSIKLSGTTVKLSVHELTVEDFEITSITDTEICGNFTVDEKWTKMSGEFKVPFVK
jgi:hypothetical protein